MIGLCLALRSEQRIDLEQLQLSGGATTSIFPLVEAWLQESTDHWNALRAVSSRKIDDGFWSIVDFIFVGVFPKFRRACFRFYSGDGPVLHEMISEPERRYFERKMLAFLEVAYAAFSEKRRLSWSGTFELMLALEVA